MNIRKITENLQHYAELGQTELSKLSTLATCYDAMQRFQMFDRSSYTIARGALAEQALAILARHEDERAVKSIMREWSENLLLNRYTGTSTCPWSNAADQAYRRATSDLWSELEDEA